MKGDVCDDILSLMMMKEPYNDDDVTVRNLISRPQIMYVYLIMVMQKPCLCLRCIWSVALTSAFLISWKAVVAGEVHFSA